MPSETQISMKEEEEEEEASPETQNETTPESKQTSPSFSKLLQGVMTANSSVSSHPFHKDVTFQGQFGMSHQDALASVTAKAEAQDQIQKLQPETSVLALSTALTHEEKPSSPHNSQSIVLANLEADDIPKTPNSDGFSWRKYGQKQVKNSGSSRSYYRCTYYNCCAKKKVQHLDISGKIIEVVYKGEHNHDPPTNLKGSNRKRDRDAPLTPQSNCQKEVDQIVVPLSHESLDQTPRVKNEALILPTEAEGCRSSNGNEIGMTDSMKEYDIVPFKKRRIKECGKASSESVYRTFKEPKVVVHAAGDVGSPSDGYRWRKYGQKMVKGNPNPRSYYRCSSSGCPVRKHVEKSSDNSTVVVVTYEGIHDHEKPLPKGLPKPDRPTSPPPGSIEDGSDHKPKGGPDKALESARTLLSIGFELKSC